MATHSLAILVYSTNWLSAITSLTVVNCLSVKPLSWSLWSTELRRPFLSLQVSSALTQGRHIRRLAIRVLRNMLVKHELDNRYEGEVSTID